MSERIVGAAEARRLLASSTAGRNGGTMRREHRTLYATIPGEGADAGNVREYQIGTAHIATGDAALWEAAGDLAYTVVALTEERDQAQIAAADLIEIIGETAWGIQLPTLFVCGPIMLPDGTIGANAIPTALAPESAKQLVEHLYGRAKTGRGWLREARRERDEARRERDEARRERDRLLDILACETGRRAPEGWTWHVDANTHGYWMNPGVRAANGWPIVVRRLVTDGWSHDGRTCRDFALESIECADRAAKEGK